MTEVDAIVAASALHGPVACGKDNRLALIGLDDFRFRLRPRLLFDQNEFPALPVAAPLPEQENHLQGKADFPVEILVQSIVAAAFVMQHQGRRLGLARLMTDFQECVMV